MSLPLGRAELDSAGAAPEASAQGSAPGAGAVAGGAKQDERRLLRIDPRPKFALSPYLYMQFMEPLGITDSSVEAAWDHGADRWRPDVVEVTRRLGPTLLRWGGCLSSYYRWREGIGPRDRRKPYLNLCWGGVETSQIGTHEFVDFCRQVGAEPLYCVNFESDGRKFWHKDPKGGIRVAGPDEAAEWVAYCNNPDHAERKANGAAAPFGLKLWQIGNETSYDSNGFDLDTAIERTIAFAKAMRAADPRIELIGWGDSGWARRMLERAGEHLQYLAFHHHFGPGAEDSPLRGEEWRKDPDRTWQYLLDAHKSLDARIRELREEIAGHKIPLAMTEGHFALPGRNRCEVLSTWAAGVADARMLNVQARHGDVLKIATLADFCGTRWQNNAIMIPVPGGQAFMMPVARVMSLFRHHTGTDAVAVTDCPADLDVTASRTTGKDGNRVFLHVVNTRRTRAVEAELQIDGARIAGGRAFTLAAEPEFEVFEHRPEVLEPVEAALPAAAAPPGRLRWTFPAASVTAVELTLHSDTV
ncbi:MAG: alpha-L-arabinofuranosidase C-terminal domain-containing protein [Planctomycetota bacterium]